MIKNLNMKLFLMALTFFFGGCEDKGTGWTPDMIPDDPVITPGDDADTEGIHTYNALSIGVFMNTVGNWSAEMKNWSMPVGKDRLLICLKVPGRI